MTRIVFTFLMRKYLKFLFLSRISDYPYCTDNSIHSFRPYKSTHFLPISMCSSNTKSGINSLTEVLLIPFRIIPSFTGFASNSSILSFRSLYPFLSQNSPHKFLCIRINYMIRILKPVNIHFYLSSLFPERVSFSTESNKSSMPAYPLLLPLYFLSECILPLGIVLLKPHKIFFSRGHIHSSSFIQLLLPSERKIPTVHCR